MALKTATAAEIKNDFEYYLNIVMNGDEVIVTQNGNEVARLVPKNVSSAYLTDSLIGVLQGIEIKGDEKEKSLKGKI